MSRDREYNRRRRSPEPEGRRHDDSGRYPDRDDRRNDDRNGRDDDDGRRGSDNDDYYDDRQRERSPVDTRSKGGQAKGQRARGRWRDAGEDQVRLEKRQARLDRMKKVMRLFEDSLLIDQVDLKDKKDLANDVRERLEELKREHAERLKEQVTNHWTNLTKEGRESRGSGEEGGEDRHRARPARSGQLYNREKSRIMSGNATHNGRGDHSRDHSPDQEHSPERRQRDGSSRNGSRERDRLDSGRDPQRRRDHSKSPDDDRSRDDTRRDNHDERRDNHDERRDNRQDTKRNEPARNRDAGNRRPHPRGQDSGNVTNRRRNRLDSGGTRR